MVFRTLKIGIYGAIKKSLLLAIIFISLTAAGSEVGRKDTVLKVLAIGNSFSVDALESYLFDLAKAANKKIIIGNMVIGGASLNKHLKNAQEDNAVYSYFTITSDGIETRKKNVRLSAVLKNEKWDYISLQQHSPVSGKYNVIMESLPDLVAYVRRLSPHSELIYHQTWAYESTSDHKRFVDYDRDQMKMYHSIVDASKRVAELGYFELLVPAGTAIQNGRTSEIGDRFTRDGFHLNKDYGRFTVACCWYEMLFGKDVRENPFNPGNLSGYEAEVAKEAAHAAVKVPFNVTPIKSKKEHDATIDSENGGIQVQNNLSLTGTATASSSTNGYEANRVTDGNVGTYWRSGKEDKNPWAIVKLPGATEIVRIGVRTGNVGPAVSDFKLQFMHNGAWKDIWKMSGNTEDYLIVGFDKPVLSDRIRFITDSPEPVELVELELYGQVYVDSTAADVKKILVNQSGYNLNRIKRFSAPTIVGQMEFQVLTMPEGKEVYRGNLQDGVGDFSDFNPTSESEYVIAVGEHRSYPFRIGVNWLERVTYRNMVDFMVGARHYVGTTKLIRPLSWEWRDGDFFHWAQQSLVSLYMSNPEAFNRMEPTVRYVPNGDFPEKYTGKWGALHPYLPEAPDIVKLIHWDADVKISQQLEHEMQKAELAYFLYAWPSLKQWLPKQNFDVVYAYLKTKWSKSEVEAYSTTQYDQSSSHDLLALKTKLGTTKGELPPGYSVIPNLMMYEVAKSQGEKDAEKYFKAAYNQLEWMIQYLDWNDPMTTKGQRMSEHITMRAFAYFFHKYPDRLPNGLGEKVEDWAKVMISRSDNYWDFRRYSDEEWTPPSWNETGNVLGFPAAAFSAMSILKDNPLCKRLEELAWAHLDNAFGRNPTGRHFSYRGPEEIEGVDLGWYSMHKGGYGLLDEVRFVFDGSPKSFHYPNHPEVGNLGWTEGWVQFNTAFNLSIAYLTNYYSEISLKRNVDELKVSLKIPLNFNYDKEDFVDIELKNERGETLKVGLKELSRYSDTFVGTVRIEGEKLINSHGQLSFSEGDVITATYGMGFMKKEARLKLSTFTVMGLGDSITAGGSKNPSYLFSLSEKLEQEGYMANFIGSRQSTLDAKTINHSGFGGMNAEFLDMHIDSIYREFPADVVLLHAGHNYFVENKPVSVILAAQRSIISKIININPNARIFVAQVIESGKLPKYSYIPELNDGIKLMVKDLGKTWSGIYLVDLAASFDWQSDTIEDRVHPNAQGSEKIAETWFRALEKHLKNERK